MKKTTKTILASGAVLAGVHASLEALSDTFFKRYFVANRDWVDIDLEDVVPEGLKEQYLDNIETYSEWFKSCNKESLEIESYDGLKLSAMYCKPYQNAVTIILVHGYNCDRYVLLKQSYDFARLGYNTLMIDQRCCGASEGTYITFGLKESLDLCQWIDLLISKESNIVLGLYGVSMGAATIMMALGYTLPKNVKFAIEEAGYSSGEIILEKFAKDHNFPKSLCRFYLNKKIKSELGFSIDDINPAKSLQTNEIPICLIHSTSDKTVPFESIKILYNANKGRKYYYQLENAYHAYACYEDGYYQNIDKFIREFI